MFRKALAGALALTAVAAANLDMVCEVTVAGETLPGTYSSAQVEKAAETAGRWAEEISRGEHAPPEYQTRRRLILGRPDGDAEELRRALLESAGGVAIFWEVSVGGEALGVCDDPSALGEVMEVMLYNGASREAVAVDFTEEITLRKLYGPEGAQHDLMELSALLRGATQVMSMTPSGAVRYG